MGWRALLHMPHMPLMFVMFVMSNAHDVRDVIEQEFRNLLRTAGAGTAPMALLATLSVAGATGHGWHY